MRFATNPRRIALAIAALLSLHAAASSPDEPKPAQTPASKSQATPKRILLNYAAAPWEQVLPQLAENLQLPLLMELKPPGTFTYSDAVLRSPDEALDLVNGALLSRDFTLLRGPQFLAVAPLDKPLPPELVPNVAPPDLAKRGANEFVSHTIQLKHLDPATLQDDVRKLLSKHGTIAPLSRLKLITLVDIAGNVRKAADVVGRLDEASRPSAAAAPPPPKVERVYPLRHIDGEKTVPVVTALLDKAGAVVAGPQNRSIVVIATEADHQRLQKVVDKLDIEAPATIAGAATIRKTLTPKQTDATALAQSLQNIWPRRRTSASFAADKASNLLVVDGTPEIVKQIEALVAELDAVAGEKAAVERVYRPRSGDASGVYTTMQSIFAGGEVRISLDPRGESVIVRAAPAEQARIAKLFEQLEGPGNATGAPIEAAIKLQNATAGAFANTLATLFPKPSTVTHDTTNNLLLIRAAPEIVVRIKKLVESIDVPIGLGERTEEVYKPKFATAAELSALLVRLFPAATNVAFVPAPAGNALILSAPKEFQPRLKTVLETIDVAAMFAPSGRVEVYPAKHATAASLQTTLARQFASRSDVAITLDARGQSLVVQAPDLVHKSIVELLAKLDAAPSPDAATTTQVYKLRFATAAELTTTLQKLYPVDRTHTEISADISNNLLVVSAKEEVHRKIAELLQRIDLPPEAKVEERIYRIDRLEPNAASAMLRSVFAADGKTTIAISGDGRTLVVQAPKLVHTKIEALLEKLRKEAETGQGNVAAAFRIQHATASQISAALQAAMPDAQTIGRITYEPTSNAILVVGPADLRQRVEKMIATLDIDPNADVVQREYPAKHVRAMELVRKLRFLLPASLRTTVSHELDREVIVVLGPPAGHERVVKILETVDVPRDPNTSPQRDVVKVKNATASTLATTLTAAFPATQYIATITADPYNNFIVIDAPPATLAQIKELAAKLDVSPNSEKVERTYALRKVKAGVVQAQLSVLFPAPSTTSAIAASDAQSIVVSTSPELHARVQKLIAELDSPPAAVDRLERVYRLEYAAASALARSLQLALADADAQFVPDDSNRTVIASFHSRHEKRIEELIKLADRPKAMSERQIAVLPLATLDPSDASSVVRRIFDQDPSDVRPAIETTEFPPQLIVRGTNEQLAQIRSALTQLGEGAVSVQAAKPGEEPQRTEPLLRAIRIARGSPRAAAEAIRRLWPRLRRNPMLVVGDDLLPPALPKQDSIANEPKSQSPAKVDQPTRPLPGRADQPVTVSFGNNRLLVSSLDAAAVRLVEQLVETLTEDPSPERGEFRVFALDQADAADVAKAVDEALNGSQAGGGRRRFGGERVRAVADPAGGSIIVRASMIDLVTVENLVRSMDQKPTGKSVRSPRILPLKRAKADEVVAVLKEVYADYLQPGSGGPMALPGFSTKAAAKAQALAIGIDAASNSLVIAATDEVFEQIKTLVSDLDRTLGEGGRGYRLMPLKNASPLDVEEALDILFDRAPNAQKKSSATPSRRTSPARPPRSNATRKSPNRKAKASNPPGELPPLTIRQPEKAAKPKRLDATDIATIRAGQNGVEINGVAENKPDLDSNEKLDPAVTPAGWVEAAQRAAAAKSAPDGELGALGSRVEIRALPEIGVLLLLGDEAELKQLAEIVDRIERLAADRRLTFKVVPLLHAKSAPLAELLKDLFRRVLESRNAQSRTEAQAEVIALAKPNSLLLAASKDDLQLLSDLTSQFDVPTPAEGQFTIFKLEHARATDLSRTIQSFYQNRTADGELSAEIVVEADPRSNSMIVHAAPRDMEEVKLLVKQLDTSKTAFTNSLRVFPLRFGTAEEIARVMQGAIQGSGTPTGETAQGVAARARPSLQLILADGKNRKTVESSILDMVRITPNPRANTLIVSAPAQTMNLIEALIAQLDVRPEAQAEIKVFTLANSDAAAMILTLRTLFLQAQGPNRTASIAPAAATGPATGPATGDSGSPLIELSFAVDARTNSILAAGTRDQLEVVEAIVLRLDGSNIEERRTEVLKLRNAVASDVAGAITDLLQRQADVARLQEGVSLRQQIESEVVVVPEVTTNSLLISSTPRFYSKLLAVIERLDEAPPQVVIQVLIVQVDLDKSNEFGIEVGLQDSVLFRRGIFPGVSTLTPTFTPQGVSIVTNSPVTPGIPGFNFNSTNPLGNNPFTNNSDWVGGQSLSNLGVGRSSSAGYGGLVLSASSESVNLLLRALARDQKIEVLSRPQVMALDNQTAFIQVGQQVPLIQNSVIQANVGVVNTVTYQDVGIILVVTPKISPDGSVVLRVDPEISALAPVTDIDSRVEISTGVFARAINTTRAQTTVSARDGQTAVIGGLIRRENSNETRKVPLLGDVPVVGWAFKYEQKRCLKRELLFFLTPHIVRTQDDAERIKQAEADRMNWCLSPCELAEIGVAPKPEPAKVDSKSSHFWHRWKKEKSTSTAPAPTPGAMQGLLPTTVSHEPPPLSSTTPKLDPSMWPKERTKAPMAGRPSSLTATKAEASASLENLRAVSVPNDAARTSGKVAEPANSTGQLPPPAPLPSSLRSESGNVPKPPIGPTAKERDAAGNLPRVPLPPRFRTNASVDKSPPAPRDLEPPR